MGEIREYVRQYVSQENLQHPTDPSIINLDPILADAVLVKGENLIVTFRWDKLTSRITSKMSKGYSMEFKCGNKSRHQKEQEKSVTKRSHQKEPPKGARKKCHQKEPQNSATKR